MIRSERNRRTVLTHGEIVLLTLTSFPLILVLLGALCAYLLGD